MKETAKQLTLIIFLVWLLSTVITVTVLAIGNYNSIFAYITSLSIIWMQSILALSSYLNLFKTVRNNRLYSALSFFALPVLLMLVIPWDFTALLIIELPFFILLLVGFLWFRKKQTLQVE